MVKNQLKYYSSLLKKKSREQEKKFIIEGIKILLEALHSPKWLPLIEVVLVTPKFIDDNPGIIAELSAKNLCIDKLKEQEFSKISDTVSPQGIAAVLKMPENNFGDDNSPKIVVALENISDPGNIGTILRNCDWFGISEIVVSAGSAELFNPKAIRSSMGSLFHLNVHYGVDLPAFVKISKKKGYQVVLADLHGESIFTFHSDKKIVVILSNEANGPGEEILNLADCKVTIPKLGKAESLNVASASAVILSQLTKV